MAERGIRKEDALAVAADGEVIEAYSDAAPHPRELILGWAGGNPLHVVLAYNAEDNVVSVVTAHAPDPAKRQPNLRRRKR